MQTFIIAAVTIDGFIARSADQISTNWTSEADKQFFINKTKQAGVMVMGRKTFETIGRALPKRLTVVMTSDVGKITDNWPTFEDIQHRKGQVVYTNLTPQRIIAKLKQLHYPSIAICGGASIYTQFIQLNLVNKLYLTVEPVVFGLGIKLFNKDLLIQLKLISSKKLNNHGAILVEWKVLNSH